MKIKTIIKINNEYGWSAEDYKLSVDPADSTVNGKLYVIAENVVTGAKSHDRPLDEWKDLFKNKTPESWALKNTNIIPSASISDVKYYAIKDGQELETETVNRHLIPQIKSGEVHAITKLEIELNFVGLRDHRGRFI